MNVQLPPALFYGVGVILIVFGTLRAYHLGWQRREAIAELASIDDEMASRRARETRRHIMFGVVWVVMGLFLVISTIINNRR